MTWRINFREKNGQEVWNRRKFVPKASFKTKTTTKALIGGGTEFLLATFKPKTTTKALIGFHDPYFWILRHLFQPISIGPGGEKGSEKKLCITPVSSASSIKYYPKIIHLHLLSIFDGHLPTPFSFLWWIYCEKKYGGRKGMALPLLSQLTSN